MYIDPSGYLAESIKNAVKGAIRLIADDWRRNTMLNVILTFGSAILGGVKSGNITREAVKHTLFMPKRTKTVNVIISTLLGTFKGALKGFIAGLGA